MAQTRRAQILMDPKEYEELEHIARRKRVSVGELIRLAVRAQYLQATDDRLAAVERIGAMNLPTPAWTEVKRDIEDAYDAGLP